MPLVSLLMSLLCLAACARTAELTPLQLQVVDAQTGEPVDAILIVRTLDPRHPLRVADLVRPEATARRTYMASAGRIAATFDATLEQAELVARGYEPHLISIDRQRDTSPVVIGLQRSTIDRP